jgi:hypothetical protein
VGPYGAAGYCGGPPGNVRSLRGLTRLQGVAGVFANRGCQRGAAGQEDVARDHVK